MTRLREHAPVQRVALAHDPALDHHDRRMPAALGKRLPPLGQPLPVVDVDRDAGELVLEGVVDDVHRERALAAGDVDLERSPLPCPAVQGSTARPASSSYLSRVIVVCPRRK